MRLVLLMDRLRPVLLMPLSFFSRLRADASQRAGPAQLHAALLATSHHITWLLRQAGHVRPQVPAHHIYHSCIRPGPCVIEALCDALQAVDHRTRCLSSPACRDNNDRYTGSVLVSMTVSSPNIRPRSSLFSMAFVTATLADASRAMFSATLYPLFVKVTSRCRDLEDQAAAG